MIPKEAGTVAVVYHFFAHYRGPILQELLQSQNYRYIFVGDICDPLKSGIKAWRVTEDSRFIRTSSKFLRGHYLIQSGVIQLALRSDIQGLIFLGDAQFLTTWFSAALARLYGKRVLFWTQGWSRREGGAKGWIRCSFYRLAHGLLLYGNRAKAIAVDKGFHAENLYVVYNSLDYKLQKSLRGRGTRQRMVSVRGELFADPHRPMIICTSRLIPARRLDLLLEAMRHLNRQQHMVNTLLVGDGPERERLEYYALEQGLSVKLYGECYDEETLADFFMAANVTVAPGKVGLTAVHSLAYGVPVVTHGDPDDQMPEWEAIVPGKSGGFFRPGDSFDLARAIREWTGTEFPDERVREQCYQVVESYYNPEFQCRSIELALRGEPADDTIWMKWSN